MSRVLDYLCNSVWAIEPDRLAQMIQVANRDIVQVESLLTAAKTLEQPEFKSMLTEQGERLEGTFRTVRRGKTAIIDLNGPIAKRMSLFAQICYGGTSTEMLVQDFAVAMNDHRIKNIVLHIDSPGGEAMGINEFSDMIFAGRKKKEIVAYISGYGASGAYWIASQASKVVIDDMGLVGSIGVVTSWIDSEAFQKATGIVYREMVSSNAPKKRLDLNSDEGRLEIQKRLDAMESVFHAKVERGRGVSHEHLSEKFNQGGVLIGKDAVAVNMVDEIGSLEKVLADLGESSNTVVVSAPIVKSKQKGEENMSKMSNEEFWKEFESRGLMVTEKSSEPAGSSSSAAADEPKGDAAAAKEGLTEIDAEKVALQNRVASLERDALALNLKADTKRLVEEGRLSITEQDEFRDNYLIAASDDAVNPLTREDGKTRVQLLVGQIQKRPANPLTVEKIKVDEESGGLRLVTQNDGSAVDEKEVDRLFEVAGGTPTAKATGA